MHEPSGSALPLPLHVVLSVYSLQVGPVPSVLSQQLQPPYMSGAPFPLQVVSGVYSMQVGPLLSVQQVHMPESSTLPSPLQVVASEYWLQLGPRPMLLLQQSQKVPSSVPWLLQVVALVGFPRSHFFWSQQTRRVASVFNVINVERTVSILRRTH